MCIVLYASLLTPSGHLKMVPYMPPYLSSVSLHWPAQLCSASVYCTAWEERRSQPASSTANTAVVLPQQRSADYIAVNGQLV